MVIALVGLCVVLDVAREVFFKAGVLRVAGHSGPDTRFWYAAGMVIWAVEVLLWAEVLTRLALNVAFPLMSLTYALAPLAGRILFREEVSPKRWAGILAIALGSGIVGVASLN